MSEAEFVSFPRLVCYSILTSPSPLKNMIIRAKQARVESVTLIILIRSYKEILKLEDRQRKFAVYNTS